MNAREVAGAAARRLEAAGLEDARFEAEVLVREAAGISRAAYFAGAVLEGEARRRLEAWLERRERREPLAYITGWREFYGRRFAIGQGVLIPRPETELLVEVALRELSATPGSAVVEVGTGSGAIAVSIAAEAPGTPVTATDISREALRFAALNAAAHAPWVHFVRGDLAAPVRRADVVLANLPYIPSPEIEALEPEVSRWEPRVALDGGPDGLALIRALVADCAGRLRPRLLALEVGFGQAEAVATLGQATGAQATCIPDLAGIDRVVCLRWE
ncbi:peptide chain release factor N(5)-glutamine methyltransferase [Tepidiforma thermophila]|uniref:Release factor glutamine methyltransferase n=1 Tax=Tepidiforma thermophila (strain KCTC 52669 / CGMCC 1.13589 / G233) TaxID=2761530 RepID=A0A2A9HFF1_TEPT2|nr:peptide chain release factor N(5)-glutamine methyltransferase [Tepidiforma thermophila]PFG74734.1 release factor glutamine methyltransferase [Tepidiforma thermophila]